MEPVYTTIILHQMMSIPAHTGRMQDRIFPFDSAPNGLTLAAVTGDNNFYRMRRVSRMTVKPDYRLDRRFRDATPLEMEDRLTGFRYHGTCYNRSRNGMYVEAGYAPRPKRRLQIHLPRAADLHGSPIQEEGEVRWRRLVSGCDAPSVYGMGLQLRSADRVEDQHLSAAGSIRGSRSDSR